MITQLSRPALDLIRIFVVCALAQILAGCAHTKMRLSKGDISVYPYCIFKMKWVNEVSEESDVSRIFVLEHPDSYAAHLPGRNVFIASTCGRLSVGVRQYSNPIRIDARRDVKLYGELVARTQVHEGVRFLVLESKIDDYRMYLNFEDLADVCLVRIETIDGEYIPNHFIDTRTVLGEYGMHEYLLSPPDKEMCMKMLSHDHFLMRLKILNWLAGCFDLRDDAPEYWREMPLGHFSQALRRRVMVVLEDEGIRNRLGQILEKGNAWEREASYIALENFRTGVSDTP